LGPRTRSSRIEHVAVLTVPYLENFDGHDAVSDVASHKPPGVAELDSNPVTTVLHAFGVQASKAGAASEELDLPPGFLHDVLGKMPQVDWIVGKLLLPLDATPPTLAFFLLLFDLLFDLLHAAMTVLAVAAVAARKGLLVTGPDSRKGSDQSS
jgi:hypothetical protein